MQMGFALDPQTGLEWLVEAAAQRKAFAGSFLCEWHSHQVQRDELSAVLRAVRAGALSEAEAIERLSQSPHYSAGHMT